MELFFIGSVVPDLPAYRNEAFSRAGNMPQENLIASLTAAGVHISGIISQHPMRSFPHSRVLWYRGGKFKIKGHVVNLIPFINLPLLRPLSVGFAVLLAVLKWGLIYRKEEKVVYTFNLTEPPGLFTLLASYLIGAKMVAWINDINVPGQTVPATLSRRLDYLLQRWIIPHCSGLVVVSEAIIRDFAPGARFIRINGGIGSEVLKQLSKRMQKRTDDDMFTIVTAGSLDKANGIREILDAFTLLPGGQFRLLIAGAGPLEEEVRRATQLNDRIRYYGLVDHEKVLDLYDQADVLINMRLTKTLKTEYFFPSKLIEYLASGIPVITTCTDQVEKEFAEVAFLLRDESPQGLAKLIISLSRMTPEERKRKGREAHEYIIREYSWEAQGRRIANFLASLASSRSVP